ncbi:transposase family protein [Treponema pedis]
MKKFIELKNGIPSADTILRVLSHIDSKQFERIFTEWTKDYFKSQPPCRR